MKADPQQYCVLDKNPLPTSPTLPGTRNGRPGPIPCPVRPSPATRPGVLTRPWRAAPGPPPRGHSGSCSWPWRPAPNFTGRRVPRCRGWTVEGASTCHQLRARRPVPGSQRRLCETRAARREVSGGERIGVRRGGAPRALQVGACAEEAERAGGSRRSCLLVWSCGWAGRGREGQPRALPPIPPPAWPPPVPGPPRAPSAGTPAKRARAPGPRRPGRADCQVGSGPRPWRARPLARGELAWGSEDPACPLPALPPAQSHLPGPPLPPIPAPPPRSQLRALCGSSTRGRREASLKRESHIPGERG